MSSADKKPWEIPWTTQQIVENAPNWSLAGDVALLKTLEAFSDNLFKKTQETDANLKKLLHRLDETGLKLNITKNEFLSLHNRQFIESRVYEDDEIVEEVKENIAEKPKTEEEITNEMKEAVLSGLKMIDKYYYKSEVPANNSDYDSDDSNSAPLYALTVKDPYYDRPLPHIIGSEEWHKKWHVGLQESSSESENEAAVSEKFSDTDSETDLPVSNRATNTVQVNHKVSDISSEERPIANSTFRKDEEVSSETSDSDFNGSVPVRAPISNSNFAEQLAAKLGNVINQRLPREDDDDEEEVINKRPIQKVSANQFSAGLFNDEPPPLDEDIFEENAEKGLFAGGQGLFDNDGNDEVLNEVRDEQPNTKPTPTLFDDEEENDLFNTTKIDLKKPFLSEPIKISIPLFRDEPPELDDEKNKKQTIDNKNEPSPPPKKISLFDDDDNLFEDDLFSNVTAKKFTSNLFDDLPETKHVDLFDPNPPSDTDDWDTKSVKEKGIGGSTTPPPVTENRTMGGLFADETEDVANKNKMASLFDDDLFSNAQPPLSDSKSLFDDVFSEKSLFETKDKAEKSLLVSSSETKEQNENDNTETKEEEEFLFEDEKQKETPNTEKEIKSTIGGSTVFNEEPPPLTENKTIVGLFDDEADLFSSPPEESARLFSNVQPPLSNSKSLFDDVFTEKGLFKTKEQNENDSKEKIYTADNVDKSEKHLFVSSSETKEQKDFLFDREEEQKQKEADNVDKVDHGKEIQENVVATAKKLFLTNISDENTVETAKSKSPPGKLKRHNLNINVGALMPGAAPPSLLVKSQSLEIKDEDETKQKPPQQSTSEASLCSEKPISFGDQEGVETLKSVTKDRVRIPIKRKPSTRRARQEQIRKSMPDFNMETPNIFTEVATPVNVTTKKGKPLFTKEASKSLFDSPDSDSDDMFKDKSKVVTGDLFAKDDGLFGTRKPPLKKSDTIDIFNDGDDMDGDIFSVKKLPPKSDLIKKSLFDDDLDDEDDIFGSSSVKTTTVAPRTDIKPLKATIRKLDATKMEDDPLDALKGN